MDCRSFSIEHLLRISHQYGLISDYRISPTRVTLLQGKQEILLESDPEEARIFLQGLVTGRNLAMRLATGGEPNLRNTDEKRGAGENYEA